MASVIEVVAAVFHCNDRALCLRRSPGRSMAGLWEFPGGKVETGESLTEALVREINEELLVDIEIAQYLGENLHSLDHQIQGGIDQHIRLHAFLVCKWSGLIQLVDHDKLLWGSAAEMRTLSWSPADIPFVEMLCANMVTENH